MSDRNRDRAPRRRSKARPRRKKSLIQRLRRQHEFRPDAPTVSLPKLFHLTQLQRKGLLKWSLYALVCLFLLIVQDTIMSRARFFGGTTDLAVCAILLITVIEGTDTGSIFVLIASLLYFFSGSAPGAFAVALLTLFGIAAAMFRQLYWYRNERSILLCTSIALMGYEMALFTAGLLSERTIFSRIGSFLLTGLYSGLVLIPLYPLIHKIGTIGGNTWKE